VADFPGVRLHVVTGKGGTGKTTVAASLALALAGGGRKVLLVEVEGRQSFSQLFDTPPLPYEERKVAVAPGGGDVYVLSVDPEDALLDYLHMFYKLSPTGVGARALRRMGAIEFATTIAPGLRDVLLTGKVKEAVVRKGGGTTGPRAPRPDAHVYDAVVLDAPPTGRIARFLNISSEIGGLAKVGPLKTQSDGVMAVFRSSTTAVHLVTLLEEMPVQETIDGATELESVGLPVGAVIVNAVRPPLLSPIALRDAEQGTLDRAAVVAGLEKAGLDAPDALVSSLLAEATDHATRVALEERGRDALAALDRPSYELPLLADAVDLSALYELAGLLKAQGVA
jgi:anion-transporting  ArsA/GET3 family ATPase